MSAGARFIAGVEGPGPVERELRACVNRPWRPCGKPVSREANRVWCAAAVSLGFDDRSMFENGHEITSEAVEAAAELGL